MQHLAQCGTIYYMPRANYVALPELDPARYNFPVPDFVKDQERILVHPERLQCLGRLGAFTEVTVASYAGEESTVSIGVAGQGNGAAYASAAAAMRKAETGQGKYNQDEPWQSVPLTIRLNSTDMTERVQRRATKSKLPISKPELWAQACDRAVRKEARAAIWDHLVVRSSFESYGAIDKFTNLGRLTALTLGTITEAGLIAKYGHQPKTMGMIGLWTAVVNAGRANNIRRGADWRSQALSALPLPVDRALLGLAYGAWPNSIVKMAPRNG